MASGNTTVLAHTNKSNNKNKQEKDSEWYCEEQIRKHNPVLDEIQGHRGFVPPGDYDINSWDARVDIMVTGSRRRKKTTHHKTTTLKRKYNDTNEKKEAMPVPVRRRRGMPRAEPERITLCTTDFRPSFIAKAVYAGFFPFGSEIEFPGKPLESRCLMNLELGGKNRCASATDSTDHGGRVVLSAPVVGHDGVVDFKGDNVREPQQSHLPIHVGKKTLRSLRDDADSFTIRLSSSSDRKSLAGRLVETHGVDWVGFDRVRALLESASTEWDNLEAKLITIELWYNKGSASTKSCSDGANADKSLETTSRNNEEKAMISGEIGFLCGSCYTCLSLFNDTSLHPRCGRIRAEGGVLLLSSIGVRLVDVGTTADYYEQFGFYKTTRREFVSLWRHWRSVPLRNDKKERGVGLNNEMEISGDELIRMMKSHREVMRLSSRNKKLLTN